MSIEITVPQLGESIVEATVGRWQKNEGDAVTAGEPLVELETDKVNVEVSAPGDGVLSSIVKREGETVGIGEVLAQVSTDQEQAQPARKAATSAKAAAQAAPVVSNGAVDSGSPPLRGEGLGERSEESDGSHATPLARRIAAERHIDLQEISGTGSGGKITQDDVEAYLAGQEPSAPTSPIAPPVASPIAPPSVPRPAPLAPPTPSTPQPATVPMTVESRREERVRMSRRRQTIAKRLVEAQHNAAMLTTFNEIDMSAVMEVRKRRRDAFKERYNVSLGYMSFFTRAVIGALKAFPRLNAEVQGDEMLLKRYYDIGIAVGVEEGLVVPVLRDADRMSFAEIERQIAVFAEKARKNQLTLDEIRGGTFTISNGGIFGSLLSTPILNGPQVGILGMHKIEERPIALNGQVVIRPMMYVALSYDHRIVDGNEAVRFLVRIKELVEDPESLLLEG
ncbi:MAG TPA: 2-oxoglutarate dehydrogenase complex dihydrolipoyllysine-residue succinyltransferase [Ktedonobacterales bacterium]|nr:2-oxoglutarate dehydrogenase complex dihydrolipoyllysine-residue succinyltransferase [Ktedonobacterales bacterium]